MAIAPRVTLAGLGLAAIAVALGVGIVPTHVTLGAGSLRCGTVLRPDRNSEIAPVCGAAGANQLRVTLALGAVLVVLAVIPLLVIRLRPTQRPRVWAAWGVITVLVAVVGVACLGMVEYSPDSNFFDL